MPEGYSERGSQLGHCCCQELVMSEGYWCLLRTSDNQNRDGSGPQMGVGAENFGGGGRQKLVSLVE